MPEVLNVLCAGAVKGLVLTLQPRFEATARVRLEAQFGAVGAMRDALRAGAPCDVLVVTEAMVSALLASGELRAGSAGVVGSVRTAIAVPAGAPLPAIDTAAALTATLLAASALHVPDTAQSTAGAHVAAVLERLGIGDALATRLRMHRDGATAMRALADAGDEAAIGCTQATEIRYTPGLALVGALPAPFSLATIYAAAVPAQARDAQGAGRFIAWLGGREGAALRRDGGFDSNVETEASQTDKKETT